MDVTQVDGSALDDGEVAAVHRVLVDALAADLPRDPPPALEDTAQRLRVPWPDRRVVRWLAYDGGRIAGYSWLAMPRKDNTHLGFVTPTVHPDSRRRGLGTALLRAGVEMLRAEGRRTVLVEVPEGTPAAAFCDALRLPAAQTNRASVLRLAEVDWTDVLRLAATPHPGYRLVSFTGRCPDELVESYARAKTAMNDAPVGELEWSEQTCSPARLRAAEDAMVARGQQARWVVAVHEATGEVAALTEVIVSRWSPLRSEQEDTGVLAEHRGRGLGLWVKAEMLRLLRAERPDVEQLQTWNDETNEHMWRINARLGFRPEVTWTERQGRVDELAARLAGPAAGREASAGPRR